MKQLLEAIKDKFDGSVSLKASVTDMVLIEADEYTAYPYIVIMPVGNNSTYAMSVDPYSTNMVQFSIFSDERSAIEVLTIFDYLQSTYGGNKKTLIMNDGYNCIFMRLDNSLLLRDGNTWHLVANYIVEVDGINITTTLAPTTTTTSSTTTTTVAPTTTTTTSP